MRRSPRTFARTAVVLGSLFAISCGDKGTEVVDDRAQFPTSCSRSVPIFVVIPTNSTTPVFDWSPQCGVSWLVVTAAPPSGGAPATVWSIRSPENKPFGPPVTFGALPPSAVQAVHAQLVRGATYRVIVSQTVGLDVEVARGEAVFTIPE